jgi:hypothetical protein
VLHVEPISVGGPEAAALDLVAYPEPKETVFMTEGR